jgi:pimeloyl-ACP methyl ester carboxylesterase
MTTAAWESWGAHRKEDRGLRPPTRLLWLAEYRAIAELGLSLACAPLLLSAPRGDGHPVLALPGLLASDLSTNVLRDYLRRMGYDTYAWELGRNLGGIYRMRATLHDRVRTIHQKTGRKVSLIGWSLGGIYARLLAHENPESIRSVITLGSPFSRNPDASNVSNVYEFLSGEGPSSEERAARTLFPHEFDRIADDLPMPATSIFSKLDGIVDWRAALLRANDRTENIEVIGASHIGLGVNPAVLWALADRLAQREGAFIPFARGGPFTLAYGYAGS